MALLTLLPLLVPAAVSPGEPSLPNLLILVADDVGVDRVAAYGESPTPGPTPNLDLLAAGGLLFRNAWSNPICSPSRASLLTGRHPFRHGLGGNPSGHPFAEGLDLAEVLLPELLRQGSGGLYTSVALGKWHLNAEGDPLDHAVLSGFDAYAGARANFDGTNGDTFYRFHKVVDGGSRLVQRYATTDTADDAVRAIQSLPEPWLLYVAFQAAHTPYHAPPQALHGFDLQGDPDASPALHHKAAVEAMDREIGRILAALSPAQEARTTVFFVGDNGTQNEAVEPPFIDGHGKGTTYEGGINVPLLMRSPAIVAPGREIAGRVSITDLFATAAELAGIDAQAGLPAGRRLDSVSLVPYMRHPVQPSLRQFVFAESAPSANNVKRAIRGRRFKYRVRSNGTERFYDLERDPFETSDLLSAPTLGEGAARAMRILKGELRALLTGG